MQELRRQLETGGEALNQRLGRGCGSPSVLRVRIEGPAILRAAFASLLGGFPQVTYCEDHPMAVVLVGDDWEERAAAHWAQGTDASTLVLLTNRLTSLNAAQRRGISVLVHEAEPVAELLRAIVAAARHQPFHSPLLLQSMMLSIQQAPVTPPTVKLDDGAVRLSEREREVALQAAAGLSNQEIAARLEISHATVRFHLHNVFQKLEIQRRGELVRFVIPGSY